MSGEPGSARDPVEAAEPTEHASVSEPPSGRRSSGLVRTGRSEEEGAGQSPSNDDAAEIPPEGRPEEHGNQRGRQRLLRAPAGAMSEALASEGSPSAPVTPTKRLARRLALALLGIVHIAAFASFAAQYPGLVGAEGIQPAAEWLDAAGRALAARDQTPFFAAPTLGWLFGASDAALAAMSWSGVALGALLIVGLAPRLVLAANWLLYLSLFTLGGPFLSFQWDILLLEVTFCAILYAPPGWRPGPYADEPEPTAAGVWVMRLLLFKLMLMSGAVKLLSGDATWQQLTALDYHFWTQPIPHGAAWYAQHSPDWMRQLGVLANHFAELFAPWLIVFSVRGWRLAVWGAIVVLVLWAGVGDLGAGHVAIGALAAAALAASDRRPHDGSRPVAALVTLGLMASIAATGNYGFFQLLTLVLAVTLLDDHHLLRLTPRRLRAVLPDGPGPAPTRWRRRVAFAAAAVLITLSASVMIPRLTAGSIRQATQADEPGFAQSALLAFADAARALTGPTRPFATINGYGLFASMTTTRYELIIEGTADGRTWTPYPLRYKPDAPADPLRVAGLHMPRLDWQMWFAALRPRCRGDWSAALVRRLLEGAPTVRALFEDPPFADAPPRAVRIRRVDTRFTTPAEREATGATWVFEPAGEWCPTLTLDAFRDRR